MVSTGTPLKTPEVQGGNGGTEKWLVFPTQAPASSWSHAEDKIPGPAPEGGHEPPLPVTAWLTGLDRVPLLKPYYPRDLRMSSLL